MDDCARLNEVTSEDTAIMDALGLTEEQRRSAVGNCVVDSMVRPLFVQLTRPHVELSGGCSIEGEGLVKFTSEGATPQLSSADKSAVLTGRPLPLGDAHSLLSDAVYFYYPDDVRTGYLSQ